MIAIQGMEMPKSCMVCPFMKEYQCSVFPPDMSGLLLVPDFGRPEWCPMCEVKTIRTLVVENHEDVERFGKKNVVDYAKREIRGKMIGFCEKEKMISFVETDVGEIDEDSEVRHPNMAIVATLRVVVPKGK